MLFSSRRTPTLPLAALPLLGLGLGTLLLSGCFLGDAADGLACELDADCGIGVECVADPEAAGAKCCGGSCLASGNSTGPGSTGTGSGSESLSTTSSEDSSTTIVDLCGNGVWDLDQDEVCDASAPDGPDCGPECTSCGNNFLDPGEQCDNSENDNCDDCNYTSLCGNGVVDPGEVCDVWRLPEGQTCNSTCTEWLAFDWPVEEDEVTAFCSGGAECDDAWTLDPVAGTWRSGEYFHDEDENADPSRWPQASLRTRTIHLPELTEGDVIRVLLQHAYTLNYGDGRDDDQYVDYVELSLEPAGDTLGPTRNIPMAMDPIQCIGDGNGGVVDGACVAGRIRDGYCGADSELVRGAAAFDSGDNVATYNYNVPKGGMPAGNHRLRFRVQYDCSNFENSGTTTDRPDDAWSLSSVSVRVLKTEG